MGRGEMDNRGERPTDVLTSSTRQWNPGDEFIYAGVRRIIEYVLAGRINWHLWNRNPDLSIDPLANWELRRNLISNSMTVPTLDFIDVVVLAGTPEWGGPRLRPVYEAMLAIPEMPLLALGVGSADPLGELSEAEKSILARDRSLIITRSFVLRDELTERFRSKHVAALPCPSILAAPHFVEKPKKQRVGLILQTPDTGLQAIDATHYNEIAKAFERCNVPFDLISFYDAESASLKRVAGMGCIRYSERSADYLDILGEYSCIVSTRLHGALYALSLGIPSCIVDRGNYRIGSAADLFASLLPKLSADQALSWAENQPESGNFSERLSALKENTLYAYGSAVARVLADAGSAFPRKPRWQGI